jgi:hypothetical protein
MGVKALLLSSSIAMLAACGGGGSSGSDSNDAGSGSGPSISGTAAAGAPIIGQVTVKDANGVMRTTDIRSDGSYSISVSGLTAPFVFRAQGQVGGREVILVSAATSADVNGTINITPFTDLIVANMAGQLASSYFDSPDFAALTPDELNAAKTQLTQRLLPILTSVGMEAGFDLLRSAFSADHTGIDAVLDVVRVTVDADTNTALIEDLVNGNSIVDDLTSETDVTVIDAPVVPIGGVATDLDLIESRFATFNSLFATALPSPDNATLLGLFAADGSFLDSGRDVESFLYDITSDPEMLGSALISPAIVDYIDADTMKVGFVFREADGDMEPALDGDNVFVMKRLGGIWRIAGNGRSFDIDVDAINARFLPNSNSLFGVSWNESSVPYYQRNMELWVDYAPADVVYIRVSGPGFKLGGNPVASILLHRSADTESGFVPMDSLGNDANGGWIPACDEEREGPYAPCVDFSVLADNTEYTAQALDVEQQPIASKPAFTIILPRPPVSNAEAAANASQWFASFSSILPAGYSALTDGSNIYMTLTLPAASGFVLDDAHYVGWNGSETVRVDAPSLNSNTINLTWSGPAPVEEPELRLWVRDAYERYYVTFGQHRTP